MLKYELLNTMRFKRIQDEFLPQVFVSIELPITKEFQPQRPVTSLQRLL